MRKTKLLYSLALAPLLLGAFSDTEIGTNVSPLTVVQLPKCTDGQFLVYRNNMVVCEAVTGNGMPLPDCQTGGQLLTYTVSGELASFGCTPKGSILLTGTQQTMITNLDTQITQLGTQVTSIGTGSRVAARTYLGPSKTATNANLGGAFGANATCEATFGKGTSMCDVYSMYISVAAGKIDTTKDIQGLWVYQAVSTIPFGGNNADLTQGLGDNCAGYYSGSSTSLAGTKFSYTFPTGDTANRVPKFYSNTTCDTMLPIACCQ